MPDSTPPTPRSFDQALSELEGCVRKLEAGGLELEAAVSVFEQGIVLQQECQELLDRTERRIEELTSPASPST